VVAEEAAKREKEEMEMSTGKTVKAGFLANLSP
jgi:hypothetical protein